MSSIRFRNPANGAELAGSSETHRSISMLRSKPQRPQTAKSESDSSDEEGGGAMLMKERTTQQNPDPNQVIRLQVGEKLFLTTRATLTKESAYFQKILSPKAAIQRDNSAQPIFIDADPELFHHILRYFRTDAFPLLWNAKDGFSYGEYTALANEAENFQVPRLAQWIRNKNYEKAVTIKYDFKDHCTKAPSIGDLANGRTTNGNVEKTFERTWTTEVVIVCPRNIFSHNKDPSQCGRACENARVAGVNDEDTIDLMRVMEITKTVVLDQKVLQ